MDKENEAYNYVLSEVAPEVDELYQYYRGKDKSLEKEDKTMMQLENLTQKKYISKTYVSSLMLIVDYYARKKYAKYYAELQNYKMRIRIFLEG